MRCHGETCVVTHWSVPPTTTNHHNHHTSVSTQALPCCSLLREKLQRLMMDVDRDDAGGGTGSARRHASALSSRTSWSRPKRKRKKRRKRKLPRSSSYSSYGRVRRRKRQWHALNAGFLGEVLLRAVFPSVVVRPAMLGIMAPMNQKDSTTLVVDSGSGTCKARFPRLIRCTRARDWTLVLLGLPLFGRFGPLRCLLLLSCYS